MAEGLLFVVVRYFDIFTHFPIALFKEKRPWREGCFLAGFWLFIYSHIFGVLVLFSKFEWMTVSKFNFHCSKVFLCLYMKENLAFFDFVFKYFFCFFKVLWIIKINLFHCFEQPVCNLLMTISKKICEKGFVNLSPIFLILTNAL